jgi:hypothetical protein
MGGIDQVKHQFSMIVDIFYDFHGENAIHTAIGEDMPGILRAF